MVYCTLISKTDQTVTYAYGGSVEDMTGKVIFHFNDDLIEIVNPPQIEDAPQRHLKRLYGNYREEFLKGIFKERISYES